MGAFAALRDPISRTYYDRKIAQGKRHNQALIALARRRCDVLFAVLRDGTLYQPDRRDEKPRCGKPIDPLGRDRSRPLCAAPTEASRGTRNIGTKSRANDRPGPI